MKPTIQNIYIQQLYILCGYSESAQINAKALISTMSHKTLTGYSRKLHEADLGDG